VSKSLNNNKDLIDHLQSQLDDLNFYKTLQGGAGNISTRPKVEINNEHNNTNEEENTNNDNTNNTKYIALLENLEKKVFKRLELFNEKNKRFDDDIIENGKIYNALTNKFSVFQKHLDFLDSHELAKLKENVKQIEINIADNKVVSENQIYEQKSKSEIDFKFKFQTNEDIQRYN